MPCARKITERGMKATPLKHIKQVNSVTFLYVAKCKVNNDVFIFWQDTTGSHEGKIATSCPPGQPITAPDLVHLAAHGASHKIKSVTVTHLE